MTKRFQNDKIKVVKILALLGMLILGGLLVGCSGSPPAVEANDPDRPPEEAPQGSPGENPAEFVVTEEIYSTTFEEIEAFIANLNEIISREDYETWLTYLSEEYITRTTDPGYLKAQSEKPTLKKRNIVLQDLRDYFLQVVVPSRREAKVCDIEFIDQNRVKAFSIIRDTRGILYLLVRQGGQWKIGVL